jgi:hypothetical protein
MQFTSGMTGAEERWEILISVIVVLLVLEKNYEYIWYNIYIK